MEAAGKCSIQMYQRWRCSKAHNSLKALAMQATGKKKYHWLFPREQIDESVSESRAHSFRIMTL